MDARGYYLLGGFSPSVTINQFLPYIVGRKEVNMKKTTDFIHKVIETANKATAFEYIDTRGETYTENASDYSSAMTKTMVGDIKTLALLIGSKDLETSKSLFKVCTMIKDKDINLRRIFDDAKDKRPISDYDYESTECILERLTEVKDAQVMNEESFTRFKDRIKSWVMQVTRADTHAFCITNYAFANEVLSDIEFGLYEDKDAKFMTALLTLNKIFLKSIVKLSLTDDLASDCMERVEISNAIVNAVRNEDTEVLDRLYAYANTVTDFSE